MLGPTAIIEGGCRVHRAPDHSTLARFAKQQDAGEGVEVDGQVREVGAAGARLPRLTFRDSYVDFTFPPRGGGSIRYPARTFATEANQCGSHFERIRGPVNPFEAKPNEQSCVTFF